MAITVGHSSAGGQGHLFCCLFPVGYDATFGACRPCVCVRVKRLDFAAFVVRVCRLPRSIDSYASLADSSPRRCGSVRLTHPCRLTPLLPLRHRSSLLFPSASAFEFCPRLCTHTHQHPLMTSSVKSVDLRKWSESVAKNMGPYALHARPAPTPEMESNPERAAALSTAVQSTNWSSDEFECAQTRLILLTSFHRVVLDSTRPVCFFFFQRCSRKAPR